MFGSSASHGIYALFIAHVMLHTNGKAIGLIRGASTRFATRFLSMYRSPIQQGALVLLVHDPKFAVLDIVQSKHQVMCATKDAKNSKWWRAEYYLIRIIYAALIALRYADTSKPGMDNIFFLTNCVMEAILKYEEVLNNEDLFNIENAGNVDFKIKQVYLWRPWG